MSHRRTLKIQSVAASMLALGLLPTIAWAAASVAVGTARPVVGQTVALSLANQPAIECADQAPRYRFAVWREGTGNPVFLRDYRPLPRADWVPALPGSYLVRAEGACFDEGSGTNPKEPRDPHYVLKAQAERTLSVGERDTAKPGPVGGSADALVFATGNRLVRLLQVKTCPVGAESAGVRAEFEQIVDGVAAFSDPSRVTATPVAECKSGARPYFLLAGMRPDADYRVRLAVPTSGGARTSPIAFHTGELPADLNLFFASRPGYKSVQDSLLMSAFLQIPGIDQGPAALPVATDLHGVPIWYYGAELDKKVQCAGLALQDGIDDGTLPAQCQEGGALYAAGTVLTTLGQGRALILAGNDRGLPGQYLREVNLAGDLIREIAIDTVRANLERRLSAQGGPAVRIGAFDHDAVRLANGRLVVQVTGEADLAFKPGAPAVHTVAGILADLNDGLEVEWFWSPFADPDMPRIIGGEPNAQEMCKTGKAGCPALFDAPSAYDWTHGNAIAYSPADGNLVYSMRHRDAIVKLLYGLGQTDGTPDAGLASAPMLWRFGPPVDEPIPADSPWFSHQHGLSYLPRRAGDTGGRIILLDNGNARQGSARDSAEAPEESGETAVHSRGQTWLLQGDDTGDGESAPGFRAGIDLDLGHYSPALGMAQGLASDRYHFTLGALFAPCVDLDGTELAPLCAKDGDSEDAVRFAESREVDASGRPLYSQWAKGSLYRSWRLRDLYVQGSSAAGFAD